LAAAVFGLIFLIYLWQYLHTGTIIITSSSDGNNYISISFTPDEKGSNKNGAPLKEGQGSISAKLPAGEYVISVHGKVLSVNKTVKLKGRQTLKYSFNPPQVSSAEPVAGVSAGSLAADSSQLIYLDGASQKLNKIDAQNSLDVIAGQTLQSVQWANPGLGLGQDQNNQLYTINNGSVSPLAAPEPYSDSKPVNYTVTQGGQTYLSFGKNLYSGGVGTNYKKIYSLGDIPTLLVASTDKVAVISKPRYGNEQKTSVAIINSTGKLLKKTADFEVGFASWSPDGKKLLLGDYDGGSEIVDTSLNEIAVLPSSNVNSPYWLSNNTLLYGVSNVLWSYDLEKGESVVFSNLTPGDNISAVISDAGQQYVYLAIQKDEGGEIERISLRGQKSPDFIYQLDIFLPKSTDNYAINYVNFTQPIILVQPFEDVEDPASPQGALQAAQSELSQDGFDLSKLQFKINNL